METQEKTTKNFMWFEFCFKINLQFDGCGICCFFFVSFPIKTWFSTRKKRQQQRERETCINLNNLQCVFIVTRHFPCNGNINLIDCVNYQQLQREYVCCKHTETYRLEDSSSWMAVDYTKWTIHLYFAFSVAHDDDNNLIHDSQRK